MWGVSIRSVLPTSCCCWLSRSSQFSFAVLVLRLTRTILGPAVVARALASPPRGLEGRLTGFLFPMLSPPGRA